MATISTQTLPSDSQLSALALNALRVSMFLSITDPVCVEALATRILLTAPSATDSTLSNNQLQLDAIKRAIWHAWDVAPGLADYRHAYLFDDDLDLTPEEALPVLFAKFSQLRTLISCARQILEPLGTNAFLEDVRQLLGTAGDVAGGAMSMRVFEEVAA